MTPFDSGPARPLTPRPTPVVVLAGLDRSTLEPVEAAVAMTLAEPALARFALDLAAGTVTRVVSDRTGVLETEVTELDHTCLTCALRHEILPTLGRLAELGRWDSIALSLPVACQTGALVATLRGMLTPHSPVRLAATVAAVDGSTLLRDVFGDDLLRERDDELHAGDSRAVGEVLVDLVEHADVVALPENSDTSGRQELVRQELALLDEVRRATARVVTDPTELDPESLLADQRAHALPDPERRTPAWSPDIGEELFDCTRPEAAEAGLWTVMVDTWKPFHPERLLASLESLGGQSYVGRGCFWLPTHPDSLAQWSGAGGQLSIGTVGLRNPRGPRTRIVITGRDERRAEVLADLGSALMTERELAAGLTRWVGRDDGFDPWLGERAESA